MKVGLVGLPGSGKTSLFCALGGEREILPHAPGDEAGLVSVEVEDDRLSWLQTLYRPRKFTPARLEFVDLPGIPAEEVRGKAELLAAVRDCDALLVVLRAFEDDPYGIGSADPKADLSQLQTEFLLGDLAVCEGRIERLQAKVKKPTPDREKDEQELALLERLLPLLEGEQGLADAELTPDEERLIAGYRFLSRKTVIEVYNIGEDAIGAAEVGGGTSLCAPVEADIASLPEGEREEFLEGYGLEQSARAGLVAACYRACGLQSFFTTGEDEVRAWTIPVGATAVESAGKIHSDLARGFIRAEVSPWEDLHAAGDERAFKAAGGSHLEGKDYVVADGDILNIRFSV